MDGFKEYKTFSLMDRNLVMLILTKTFLQNFQCIYELKITTEEINLKWLSTLSPEGTEISVKTQWLQAMMKQPATKILTKPPTFRRTLSNMQVYIHIINIFSISMPDRLTKRADTTTYSRQCFSDLCCVSNLLIKASFPVTVINLTKVHPH